MFILSSRGLKSCVLPLSVLAFSASAVLTAPVPIKLALVEGLSSPNASAASDVAQLIRLSIPHAPMKNAVSGIFASMLIPTGAWRR
jgi:hypothetical protein